MAKHKVVTTDDELDRALEDARRLPDEPRVTSAEYKTGPGLDLLILRLNNAHRLVIPREDLQGLMQATKRQIANVEIIGNGTGLHWPELDLDYYVPNLLKHIYGTKRWMAEIGRRGGAATTRAKRSASRKNGSKGGRPRSKQLTASGV